MKQQNNFKLNDRVRYAMWWNEQAKIKRYAYGTIEDKNTNGELKVKWDDRGYSWLKPSSLEFVSREHHPTNANNQAQSGSSEAQNVEPA